MRRFRLVMGLAGAAACVWLSFASRAASEAEINPGFFFTSPPAPVGSGARAMGVGGAFIAVADDATAANWNPGALIQLELPEASAVLDGDFRDIGSQASQIYDINYLSASYPFTIKKINMIISVNYQRLMDFNLDFDNTLTGNISTSNQTSLLLKGTGHPGDVNQYDVIIQDGFHESLDSKIQTNTTGVLGAISPAFAIQITPKFSLGFTANILRDGWFDWEEYSSGTKVSTNGVVSLSRALYYDTDSNCTCNGGRVCHPGDYVDDPGCIDQLIDPSKLGGANPAYSKGHPFQDSFRSHTRMKMEGESYNFGLLWDITPKWTMGAVYRTGGQLRIDREVRIYEHQTSPNSKFSRPPFSGDFNYDEHLSLPSSYGLGAGYRYSDALTISADLDMVRWDEYYYKLEDGTQYSLVTGLGKGVDDVSPTITGRVGAEYLIIKPKYVVPLRAGLFYDQEPAIPNPDSFYGITLGTGFAYKWFITDLAYVYRFGPDVHIGYAANADRTDLVEDTKGFADQHQVMLSFIFHFK